MKIDLSKIDLENFKVKEGAIDGNKVFLIVPNDIACKWTKETLHLRSVLVDEKGEILSLGLKKFFNVSEKPDLYPNPEKSNDLVFEEKMDGSLALIDFIFNQINIRTRGVAQYHQHLNFQDFEIATKKYPNLFNLVRAYPSYTFLFEIVSPNQKIVLHYPEPDIIFLGCMNKETLDYIPSYSAEGKRFAEHIGCKTPEIFQLKGNIADICEQVKLWEKKEGIVIKYNNSQNFIKCKADWYLWRHSLKSKLNSLDNLIDLFCSLNYPKYFDFHKNIEETIDFETAEELKDKLMAICAAYEEAENILAQMDLFVINLKSLPRKDAALAIIGRYAPELRGVCFSKLDGKAIIGETLRKLIEINIKK